jgi:hypothetical protein
MASVVCIVLSGATSAPNLGEGPYSESEVLKLIETSRIDRTAECRRAKNEEWKTVRDHLLLQEPAGSSGGI